VGGGGFWFLVVAASKSPQKRSQLRNRYTTRVVPLFEDFLKERVLERKRKNETPARLSPLSTHLELSLSLSSHSVVPPRSLRRRKTPELVPVLSNELRVSLGGVALHVLIEVVRDVGVDRVQQHHEPVVEEGEVSGDDLVGGLVGAAERGHYLEVLGLVEALDRVELQVLRLVRPVHGLAEVQHGHVSEVGNTGSRLESVEACVVERVEGGGLGIGEEEGRTEDRLEKVDGGPVEPV